MDVSTTYQTFEGWGTSLAWWANVVGGYPDQYRQDYLDKIFDPRSGLGLNIVRYNIGGGENPRYLPPGKTYVQFRARVPGFLSGPNASYDWSQDANQRWILQQSLRRGVTVAEAFSNSPPYWMTKSQSVTGAPGAGNNLNPAYAQAFAEYLATVVQHFHDAWGITFRTLEAFNEPASGFWHFGNNQEGCGFDPGRQNAFAKQLGSLLQNKGITYTSLSASDENSIDQAVQTLQAMDASALASITQVNTHSYSGTERRELFAAAQRAHKRLWISEYGDGDPSGLTTATQILKDLKDLHASAWVYWQAVDGRGWGLLTNPLDGTANYSYGVNPKYYVLANFSRFIRPGYTLVSVSDANSIAVTDGKGTIAIVTVSRSSSEHTVTYSLQNARRGKWVVTPYRSSSSEHLAKLPSFVSRGNRFVYRIPGASVTTFVLTHQ